MSGVTNVTVSGAAPDVGRALRAFDVPPSPTITEIEAEAEAESVHTVKRGEYLPGRVYVCVKVPVVFCVAIPASALSMSIACTSSPQMTE
jgi:hypothetical protein